MRNQFRGTTLAVVLVCITLASPSDAGQKGRNRARTTEQNPGPSKAALDSATRGRANGSRIYQDPASTTGYRSGHDLGLLDGRDALRYDPVRHRDYRDAERGYAKSYGSKDAYKTNFRAGFRQGYEAGYREGARTR